MVLARCAAVPWAFLQVFTYQPPYPPGVGAIGVGLAVLLALGNVAAWLAYRRIHTVRQGRLLGLASLALDVVVLSGFVWLYAFDQTVAVWAVLFLLPMEGAVRFRLRGAVAVWLVVTFIYALREIWGSARYDYPLDWASISYRMGIGLLLALVAGFMARDLIHQRERLERALAELRKVDQLRAALVSTLAHDVRNPLTTIRGVHSTLVRRGDQLPPEAAKDLILSAERQAIRLERLATDLLDLARLEQGRMALQLQDVRGRDAVLAALSYVDHDGRIEVNVAPDIELRADPDRLQQMLVNLATNALRHGQPPFAIDADCADGMVRLQIKDTGPGVPESEVGALFHPFRTDSGAGSVGFGLAIVKALANRHGGDVTYRPNEPQGACFELTLPSARPC